MAMSGNTTVYHTAGICPFSTRNEITNTSIPPASTQHTLGHYAVNRCQLVEFQQRKEAYDKEHQEISPVAVTNCGDDTC